MFLREAQRIRNAQAVGSSPTSSSKGRDYLCLLFLLYGFTGRLSWTKLRARPVDDEASIMRLRNKEQCEAPQASSATMFLREEQRIRNAQAVGSSPTISSKTCVNTAFSQVFSFSEMNFKIQYAAKNLTLFYGVRFCSFIRFFAQDHLLTIYEI